MLRVQILLSGVVQGMGLRPFTHRAAVQNRLAGFVKNTAAGVLIEAEGAEENIEQFLQLFTTQECLYQRHIPCLGSKEFLIQKSEAGHKPTLAVSADRKICSRCLAEFYDKNNRRYLYPFISCVDCGPRYSITAALPFDREKTSLQAFPLCSSCLADYSSLTDRRYHAQTINCAACGPQLSLLTGTGLSVASGLTALTAAVNLLDKGGCLAIKGIGGFHLAVDASNAAAVARLRKMKARATQPFAWMVRDLPMAKRYAQLTTREEHALLDPAAAIVIVKARGTVGTLGLLLAYTAVHDYIAKHLDRALVMTSANRKNHPIVIDDQPLISSFSTEIDYILTHNRAIVNPCEDSVGRCIADEFRLFRRARGYDLRFTENKADAALALGGQEKATFALKSADSVLLSPHIGSMSAVAIQRRFVDSQERLQKMLHIKACPTVADLNPAYDVHSLYGKSMQVQHHQAHFAACLFENQLKDKICGHIWDGSGYGTDKTVWGGESFILANKQIKRVASLFPFRLLGNEQAITDTRRLGWALLQETFASQTYPVVWQQWLKENFSATEQAVFAKMYAKGLNSPYCSSIGRLFDAIAALLNISMGNSYEGESAIKLEEQAALRPTHTSYGVSLLEKQSLLLLDWRSMLLALTEERAQQTDCAVIAAKFHCWLADALLQLSQQQPYRKIVLSGGVFQNKCLTELAKQKLEEKGFQVFLHTRIPCNDGGLAAGQLHLHELIKMQSLCV